MKFVVDKSKVDTIVATARQLGAELLLPAACALIATVYEYSSTPKGFFDAVNAKPGFEHLASYFLKLFYWGAFFAYVLRAMKTVRDRKNHATVIQKQEAALERMEVLAREMEGHTTGGDSYGYVWIVRHDGTHIRSIEIKHVGKFVLHTVRVGITSEQGLQRRLNLMEQTGDYHHVLQSDHNISMTHLMPNQVTSVQCAIPLTGPTTRFIIKWQARNGSWTQRLEVDAAKRSADSARSVVTLMDGTTIADPEGTVLE